MGTVGKRLTIGSGQSSHTSAGVSLLSVVSEAACTAGLVLLSMTMILTSMLTTTQKLVCICPVGTVGETDHHLCTVHPHLSWCFLVSVASEAACAAGLVLLRVILLLLLYVDESEGKKASIGKLLVQQMQQAYSRAGEGEVKDERASMEVLPQIPSNYLSLKLMIIFVENLL